MTINRATRLREEQYSYYNSNVFEVLSKREGIVKPPSLAVFLCLKESEMNKKVTDCRASQKIRR